MVKLQRILAAPMALTAAACLWLLWRQGGTEWLAGGADLCGPANGSSGPRGAQPATRAACRHAACDFLIAAVVPITGLGRGEVGWSAVLHPGTRPWTNDAVTNAQAAGKPVFVYFTADWCLTCKAKRIRRDQSRVGARRVPARRGVVELVGDWTNGDPAITRFLESRGRAACR